VRYRCSYIYGDGARCVWEGKTPMCAAHRIMQGHEERKKAKTKREAARRERQKAARDAS
jgi:hypothetical protein